MKNRAILAFDGALLAFLFLQPSDSQQGANRSTSDGDEFAQSNPAVPSEQFSGAGGCSVPNTNPYAGMNPLLCKGVAAPVDSGGQCSLAGLQVLKVVGTTCYYCQRLNPPINGIIVPLGQLPAATAKGYRCGVDEADPGCSAVCQGSAMNTAPPATTSNLPVACQQANPPAWCPNSAGPGQPDCSAGVPGGYQPRDNPECEKPAGAASNNVIAGSPGNSGLAATYGNGGPGSTAQASRPILVVRCDNFKAQPPPRPRGSMLNLPRSSQPSPGSLLASPNPPEYINGVLHKAIDDYALKLFVHPPNDFQVVNWAQEKAWWKQNNVCASAVFTISEAQDGYTINVLQVKGENMDFDNFFYDVLTTMPPSTVPYPAGVKMTSGRTERIGSDMHFASLSSGAPIEGPAERAGGRSRRHQRDSWPGIASGNCAYRLGAPHVITVPG